MSSKLTPTALPTPPKEYDIGYMDRLVKQIALEFTKSRAVTPFTCGSDLSNEAGFPISGLTIVNPPISSTGSPPDGFPEGSVWCDTTSENSLKIITSGPYTDQDSLNLANTTDPALGDALIGFRQSNASGNLTGAVGRTVHSKLQEIVSVKDFGAVGDGVTDDTAAIQQCINVNSVVFIPVGIYLISGPITINNNTISGGQRTIIGDSTQRSVIRATTVNSGLFNNVNRHDAIAFQDFTFDGNNIAEYGVVLGVNGSVGTLAASSADFFSNFRVVQCLNSGVTLHYCQYFTIQNCEFSGATNGYGLYLNECGSSRINGLLSFNNKTAMFIGGTNGGTNPGGFSQSSYLSIDNWRAYGPYSGSAEGYLHITNGHHITFNDCAFEHEIRHTSPLVWIRRTSTTVTSDIIFNECSWQGLAFDTDLIEISYCRRAIFNNCSAIIQNPGYYILKTTGAGADSTAFLTDCLASTTYSDYNTTYWKQGGYTNGNNITETQTLNPVQNWSPVLTGGTTNPTGVSFSGGTTGKYYRNANIAYFQKDFGTVTWTSAGTGDFIITGLPADIVTPGSLVNVQGTLFATSVVGIVQSDNTIVLFPVGSNTSLLWSAASSGGNLLISGFYMVS
jgi:hypothetical protein